MTEQGRSAPGIVGIVNITEDSFSDGGRFLAPDAAAAHARMLRNEGADFIELGAASSHPDARPVAPEVELERLSPVLDVLLADGAPVAIDSFQPAVQLYCAARGAAMLNDTRGFADQQANEELSYHNCRLVVMHSVQGTGVATRSRSDAAEVLKGMYAFFEERLTALRRAGIAEERIVLDPGMGFFLGSEPEPSLAALCEIPALRSTFGLPVLISVSRKSFLQKITGCGANEVAGATLAAELFAAEQGAEYLRTHDVGSLSNALLVRRRLEKG